MNRITRSILCATGAALLAAGASHAQQSTDASKVISKSKQILNTSDDAVNAICPVGKNPIDGTTFVTVKGKKVGFCCPGCDDKFVEWGEDRQVEFIQASMKEKVTEIKAAQPAVKSLEVAAWKGDIYTLGTCPISGHELGADAIVKKFDGREVRFCCEDCTGKFEEDLRALLRSLDKQLVKSQLAYIPASDTCFVSGEPLMEDGEDISINFVLNNRATKLCCRMCARELKKNPGQYFAKLDKQILAVQGKAYPLETCVVGGSELGSMGETYDLIVANRLVRFCCKGCLPKFNANPAGHLAKLDAAWKAKKVSQVEINAEQGVKKATAIKKIGG